MAILLWQQQWKKQNKKQNKTKQNKKKQNKTKKKKKKKNKQTNKQTKNDRYVSFLPWAGETEKKKKLQNSFMIKGKLHKRALTIAPSHIANCYLRHIK